MICAYRPVAPAVRALGVASRAPSRAVPICRYITAGTAQYTQQQNTLSTEDKLEIMELYHKFDMTLNMGQQERLEQFFSQDATVNIDMQQPNMPVMSVKGVKPVLKYFDSMRPMSAGKRHVTCNIIVEPDGQRAAKVTAYRLLHKACNPPVLVASGIIQDEVVNVNGEWRFAVRNFIMDPPQDVVV